MLQRNTLVIHSQPEAGVEREKKNNCEHYLEDSVSPNQFQRIVLLYRKE